MVIDKIELASSDFELVGELSSNSRYEKIVSAEKDMALHYICDNSKDSHPKEAQIDKEIQQTAAGVSETIEVPSTLEAAIPDTRSNLTRPSFVSDNSAIKAIVCFSKGGASNRPWLTSVQNDIQFSKQVKDLDGAQNLSSSPFIVTQMSHISASPTGLVEKRALSDDSSPSVKRRKIIQNSKINSATNIGQSSVRRTLLECK